MAYAMMGGIIVGIVLTLLFLPALYVAWFRIGQQHDAGAEWQLQKEAPGATGTPARIPPVELHTLARFELGFEALGFLPTFCMAPRRGSARSQCCHWRRSCRLGRFPNSRLPP